MSLLKPYLLSGASGTWGVKYIYASSMSQFLIFFEIHDFSPADPLIYFDFENSLQENMSLQ